MNFSRAGKIVRISTSAFLLHDRFWSA